MITVHHLENSRSQRVLWLLEELGVPYDVKRYARDRKTMLAPPALKAIHPLGKSPVITDGDATIAESGAITEYLLEKYDTAGRFAPAPGTPERLRYTYWLHYAEGSLMPFLVMKLIFSKIPGSVPVFVRPIANAIVKGVGDRFLDPNLATHFAFVEKELARSTWFAGEAFSAADIMMSFDLEAGTSRGGAVTPKIKGFVDRIRARPAYQRALKTGGPFELLK